MQHRYARINPTYHVRNVCVHACMYACMYAYMRICAGI